MNTMYGRISRLLAFGQTGLTAAGKAALTLLISTCAATLLATPGLAQVGIPQTVAQGSDYLQTGAGSQFNFGGSIGIVDFMGVPFGPGNTDTIAQRQADAVINGAAIPLQITALQLESTAPVSIGAYTGPVFVSLDPTLLASDVGTMSIIGSTAGGTFNSSFVVDFDVCTAVGVMGIGCGTGVELAAVGVNLSNTGSAWSPNPPAGTVIVPGAYGDQMANAHTGLPVGEVDFYPGVTVHTDPSGTDMHVVGPATPLPASAWLLLSGLGGLAALGRKRRV